MPTLAKIAKGYGVPVEDLLEEPVPLVKAPREARLADVHRLFDERQTRADWREAVSSSRRFRSRAKERLREQVLLWEAARDEGSSGEERREFLDTMGRILDGASEVLRQLQDNLADGLNHVGEPGPHFYWEEVREADTLYRELLGMVGEAGLSVHPKKTDQALGQSDQALAEWRHEVVPPAA